MPEPEGALRDRMILDFFRRHIHDALDTIGWFGPLGPPGARLDPIAWLTTKVKDYDKIPPNALIVSVEDHDIDDMEIGSNASIDRHEVWIDFYATEDALGRDVQNDLLAICRGQRRAANIDEACFTVAAVDLEDGNGPTDPFVVQIEGPRGETSHDPKLPSDRFWFAVVVYLVDERA